MFGLIGNFGPWEVAFILIIVLIIFGPGKLPQVGESLGKAIQGFKKAKNGEDEGQTSVKQIEGEGESRA
ncbi:sec-independent protein translocase protein TatA [Thermosyntropha lipolytica DSM 11003]|uniref:Sec-independent protein translocase protein TatA n=1 Tax=Thermosyntropha lipolytica DSM 11003 TaxID=1123382 RepID=A0A1M5QCY5_9FIRM|nr:twin-arginine translocase TatA/TatE family subunit [Thermosyntropha lipolytica]SHH11726.1 sec-independent protein translocase protein TatA [Thermosyntropha lipolytica DSM 11003]